MEREVEQRLWELAKRTLQHRSPQICKHLFAADILSLLESSGIGVENELAKAVVESNDSLALSLIKTKMVE